MIFKPRDYQIEALDTIYSDLREYPAVLLEAIMGSGKTAMTVKLIERLWRERPDSNYLILMHKKELVEQFLEAFSKFTKIPEHNIGVCCAGLKQRNTKRRITVGTIQSVLRVQKKLKKLTMLVVDECHTIAFHDSTTRYSKVIAEIRRKSPQCRILGVTATASRLGHGYIYGTRCKPGEPNLFPKLNHKIKYSRLAEAGYLVPLKGRVANHETLTQDLAGVSINGDYVLNQLGEIMTREQHIRTAAEAIRLHCGEYKTICVFCCTIDHAEKLHAALVANNENATIVHSQLTDLERCGNMASWKAGNTRIMVSVNILIEGFDLPRLDCLVMARPTMSSTLFLQAVGRVLRPCEGKDHGMLVDLTDNTNRFGTDLDNVKVTIPKAAEDIEKKEKNLTKLCPQCEREVNEYLRECECGYVWPLPEIVEASTLPDLVSVVFDGKPEPQLEWFDVDGMTPAIHTSRKSQKELGKISITYGMTYETANIWLCFADNYTNYAVEQSQKRWGDISNDPFPNSVDEFTRAGFLVPKRMQLDIGEKYPTITAIERGDREIFLSEGGEVVPF